MVFTEKKSTGKMDSKFDEIDNFELDPNLIEKLRKLNLDSIRNDIFEEIPKNEDNTEVEYDILAEDSTVIETADSKLYKNCAITSSVAVIKSCTTEEKVDTSSRITKRKKDINGNEEPLTSDENLNEHFVKLELSDSDNEEVDEENSLKLKERGPMRSRPRRRANRNRDQNNVWTNSEGYDVSQFDSERLRFLCGSNQILSNETTISNQFTVHNNFTTIFNRNEPIHTIVNQDSFYEDVTANSVRSPESGYDSSAQSSTGSPPPPPISLNLDSPEIVDKQKALEFVAENTDGALPDVKDPVLKINEILTFLKDIPPELHKPSSATASSNDDIPNPVIEHSKDFTIISVMPKKLVYKLDDKAKKALREFLSDDEFCAAEKRIYERIYEDEKNSKNIKVIYVEDEMDKTSENRTNLHNAVLNYKIEDIYCLIEIHKQYEKPLTDINIRDKYGKTALDYAIQNKMSLVIDYLKENTACQSVII